MRSYTYPCFLALMNSLFLSMNATTDHIPWHIPTAVSRLKPLVDINRRELPSKSRCDPSEPYALNFKLSPSSGEVSVPLDLQTANMVRAKVVDLLVAATEYTPPSSKPRQSGGDTSSRDLEYVLTPQGFFGLSLEVVIDFQNHVVPKIKRLGLESFGSQKEGIRDIYLFFINSPDDLEALVDGIRSRFGGRDIDIDLYKATCVFIGDRIMDLLKYAHLDLLYKALIMFKIQSSSGKLAATQEEFNMSPSSDPILKRLQFVFGKSLHRVLLSIDIEYMAPDQRELAISEYRLFLGAIEFNEHGLLSLDISRLESIELQVKAQYFIDMVKFCNRYLFNPDKLRHHKICEKLVNLLGSQDFLDFIIDRAKCSRDSSCSGTIRQAKGSNVGAKFC
jgi:hypothetical protein